MVTGRDCLLSQIYRLEITPFPVCSLCDLVEAMDGAHILRCPVLSKSSLEDRYWEAPDLLGPRTITVTFYFPVIISIVTAALVTLPLEIKKYFTLPNV